MITRFTMPENKNPPKRFLQRTVVAAKHTVLCQQQKYTRSERAISARILMNLSMDQKLRPVYKLPLIIQYELQPLTQCVMRGRIKTGATKSAETWCRQRLNPLVSTLCYVNTHTIPRKGDRCAQIAPINRQRKGTSAGSAPNHRRRVYERSGYHHSYPETSLLQHCNCLMLSEIPCNSDSLHRRGKRATPFTLSAVFASRVCYVL